MADKSFGVKELNLLNASGTPTVTSPNNLNLNANTVAISTSATIGNNLTVSGQINVGSNIKIGNAGVVTATSFVGSGANLTGISAGISTASSNIQATWDVIHQSASAYRFTGPGQDGAEDNPDIYLVRGHRYRFSLSSTSGSHPLQIRTTGGTTYTDGVTYSDTGNNQTTAGNDLDISVQHDAPAALKYHCTSHGGMVGNIYIVGQHLANGADNRVLTATSAYGLNGEANLTFDGTSLKIGNTFSPHSEGDNLVIGGSGWQGMTIYGEGGGGVIQFADDANNRVGQILYNHGTNEMLFRTNGNADRFEIQSNGDVTISNGNLIVASGHGIDFSAAGNAGGMSSELLDDYEEGSWTPTMQSGSATITNAKYVKIGKLVYISLYANSFSDTTSGNIIQFNGLPFTSETSQNSIGALLLAYINTQNDSIAYIGGNETRIRVFHYNQGGDYSSLTHAAITSSASSRRIFISMTYKSGS